MDTRREVELGWVAGIIDGEGSIGFYGPNITPFLSIVNTDVTMVVRVREILECGKINDANLKVIREGIAPRFKFIIHKRTELVGALETLVPYLYCKRRQAEALLDWCSMVPRYGRRKNMPQEAINLVSEVKYLNTTGGEKYIKEFVA